MPILEAENSFRNGLVALVRGEAPLATDLFACAVRIERERGAARPQMRYVSYWGLSLALSQRATHEAVRACEIAAATDSFNPDLQLNLGKVYLVAGKLHRARVAFERGALLAPEHAGLKNELRRLDELGPPVLPFVRRKRLERTLSSLRAGLSSLAQRFGVPRRDVSSY